MQKGKPTDGDGKRGKAKICSLSLDSCRYLPLASIFFYEAPANLRERAQRWCRQPSRERK